MEIFTWPRDYCTTVQPPPAKIMPIPVLKTRTESTLEGKDKAKNIQEYYKYFKILSIRSLGRKCGKCAIFREKWAF